MNNREQEAKDLIAIHGKEALIKVLSETKFYASLCLDDGGGYVTIYAKDREEARSKMFASKYGKRWAFLYDESEKPEALDVFSQKEIDEIS